MGLREEGLGCRRQENGQEQVILQERGSLDTDMHPGREPRDLAIMRPQAGEGAFHLRGKTHKTKQKTKGRELLAAAATRKF